MRRSSAEGYAVFRAIANLVTKRHRWLVLGWLVIFLLALFANQIWRAEDVTSFSFNLPQNTPSAQAQRLLEEQFPSQVEESSANVVVVAGNATGERYREFVWDLDRVVAASSALGPGESATVPLSIGGSITVDRPVEYLASTENTTVYGIYAAYAYQLAKSLDGPVHDAVAGVASAAQLYWGLPTYFLAVWSNVPPPYQNVTAKGATEAFVAATFPPSEGAFANASFQTFYQMWNASWANASMRFFPPYARAEAAIAQALPAFLDSPIAKAAIPDAQQRLLQLGMLGRFNLTNYGDAAVAEDYALSTFASLGLARLPFFQDLYAQLNGTASDADLRAFGVRVALGYDVFATPLEFPVNVTKFFVSPDRTIVLLNYGFTKDARFTEDKKQPIREDVLVIRDLVAAVKSAYALDGQAYVTGIAPSDLDQEFLLGGSADFVVTIVLVVVLIGLYFYSLLSPLFPILNIAIALMVANLFVYLVAVYVLELHFTVTAVLQIVLLATGTDYSIFIISRYRDERRDGKDTKEAVRNAGIWAGESVATSGGAVLISFAALSIGSFPIVQGMGLTIGFGVTISLLIALTFIPAILLMLGDRVFWPSGRTVAKVRRAGEHTRSERYFHNAAGFSMRHAKAILLVAVLVTVPAAYLALTNQPTYDLGAGLPSTESSRGIDAIAGAFGEGFVYPSYVVIQFPGEVLVGGNVSVPAFGALHNLTARIQREDGGVFSLEGPTNPGGTDVDYRNLSARPQAEREAVLATIAPFIGTDHRTVRITVVLSDPAFSRQAIGTVDRLREELAAIQADEPALRGAAIHVGGVTPVLGDVRTNMDHDLQVMAVIVIIGLFLVLLFVLGSVLIPIRAILTIMLSIGWTLGLTIVVYRAWVGLDVIFVLPLCLFVMAMGLGMDYDIFIITRIREEVARGKSDREAIQESVTRTGGIITACGIVMAGAFATLMLNPLPFLQQIGFALAFAILIDSSVVRIYLVPAIMVLAGKYNWWAPGRLQRVRREGKDAAKEPEAE